MDRIITTHHLRKVCEPTPVWTLTTLDAGGLNTPVSVLVPGVWESIPGLRNYRGRVVYEKQLNCGGTLRFVFGGVSFRAKVFLDDTLLTQHYGAYTAFDCIAEDVPFGKHTLRVEVDNLFGGDSALHVPNDYYSYGGISRPVTIEQLGSAYITRLHVTPRRQGRMWLADVTVTVRSLGDEEQTIDLDVKAGPASIGWKRRGLPARGEITLTATLACPGVASWSPDDPRLYNAEAVLWLDGEPADDLCDRFGFREVKVEGSKLLLNGEPVFIKGVNRHEEYANFGCAVPVEAMMRDVQLIRDLGCNLVRTSHYPNDPRFLDLCDQLGLMVWEEEHARGLSLQQMQHPSFMEQTMLCIDEMIFQHHNHPSIILWGCLNECDDEHDEGAEIFRRCFRRLHELDASRPMTAALLGRTTSQVLADMDVVSMNLYPLWYHNAPVNDYINGLKGWVNKHGGAGKPYIISEIGAGAIMGYHDPFGQSKWSEERQAAILREQITTAMAHPEVAGVIVWQFADIRLDDDSFAGRPKCMNNKGLLDEFRRPKMAYAVVKELFS
ncbi:MAG: beta-glucuronidase [Clostridiales bacterium]|nr:beta-glucuronidase [Clostridiales bacterium]